MTTTHGGFRVTMMAVRSGPFGCLLWALAATACGDDADTPIEDSRTPARADAATPFDGGDGAGDAGDASDASAEDPSAPNAAEDAATSGYGDGECTAREVEEAHEAIDIIGDLARSSLGLAQGYSFEHREMLDGIWADCTEELCPVVHAIYLECARHYIDLDAGEPDPDVDAGPPPFNPCFAAPPECDAYL